MPDEHSLGDAGDAAPQLGGPHRPSHSRQTVTMLVPINNRIAKWPATGELSRELAARWDRLHRLRVAVLVLLFAVLAVAVT